MHSVHLISCCSSAAVRYYLGLWIEDGAYFHRPSTEGREHSFDEHGDVWDTMIYNPSAASNQSTQSTVIHLRVLDGRLEEWLGECAFAVRVSVCLSVDVLYTIQGRSLTLGVLYNKLGGWWVAGWATQYDGGRWSSFTLGLSQSTLILDAAPGHHPVIIIVLWASDAILPLLSHCGSSSTWIQVTSVFHYMVRWFYLPVCHSIPAAVPGLQRDNYNEIIWFGSLAGWLAMISRSVALSWSVYGMFVITILWACAWKPTSRTSIKSINSRNSSDVNNCVLSLSGGPPAFLPVTLSYPSGRGQIDVIRNSLDSVESLNIIL